jgi:hypothetical protein
MDLSNYSADVVGIKLPNGKVQVIKNNNGTVGEVFESVETFYSKFSHINEGTGSHTVQIIESING